jgi:hypothetical protein
MDPGSQQAENHVIFLVNSFGELLRKAPTNGKRPNSCLRSP